MKKKSTAAKHSLQQVLVNALEDLKAQNIVILDVRTLTDVTDTLIIASGTSSRQVRAIAENAMEEAKKQGFNVLGAEGLDAGEWVLVDCIDAIVHVMLPETREYYDLERLWQTTATPVTDEAAPRSKATTTAARLAARGPAVTLDEDASFENQSEIAKARKSPGKAAKLKSKAVVAKKTTAAPAVAKAGVYAKTGTRKPAAKTAAATKSAVKKAPAAPKEPAVKKAPVAKTSTAKPTAKKTAVVKPTAAKPAVKKPAAAKAVAAKKPASAKPANTKTTVRKPRAS